MTTKTDSPYYGRFDEIVAALAASGEAADRFPPQGTPTGLATFADLFSGIGGFHVAASRLGMECVMACDIDPAAREAYQANFGLLPAGDVEKIHASEIPEHDALFAGLPCQPFSIIGDRRGLADPRGTLYYEVERIVAARQPRAVLIENVKQFTTAQGGRALDYVASSLADLGYGVDWRILNALDFGLPQRRERVFIVALRGYPHQSFPWPTPCEPMTPLADILEVDPPSSATVSERIRRARHAAHTAAERPAVWHENKSGKVTSHPYSCALRASASYNYLLVDGERRLTTREMLRLQGFPDEYTLDARITAARRLTGNAVAVPVVEAVLREMQNACA
ncbi:MAG: DNA (cytosine-5-)-methyltransferase [Acidimicrobiaceae bacterium]|nr:DNA (cytosine-5-)-methyltransferase [Acidimicrobiaceae bacterium]